MKLKDINDDFQSIDTSNVLSNEEMNDTLGGGCTSCKGGCQQNCKPGQSTLTQTSPGTSVQEGP